MENIVIRANASSSSPGSNAGALRIGITNADFPNGSTVFDNAKFINILVNGLSQDAVVVSNGRNITFDNLVVSDALNNNVRLINAHNVTIKNSDVQSSASGDGILIEGTARCTTIQTTNIRNNGVGLTILPGAGNIVIRENNFYCNAQDVNNLAAGTILVHNIPTNINNITF